jgi:hypothetical protein
MPMDPMDRRPTNRRDANAQQPGGNNTGGVLRSGSQSPSTGYGNPGANAVPTGFPSPSIRGGGKERTGQ